MVSLSLYLCILDNESDKDKLSKIYEKYYNIMLLTAKQFVGKYSMEEDIVHESIMKIIEHLDSINLQNEVSTKCFLRTIVRNKALDWLKHEKIINVSELTENEAQIEDNTLLPLDKILSIDGYNRLIEHIKNLSDTYKDVCNLKFVCGLKEREIAKVLDLSPKTVSVRIVRGRKILIEKILEQENHDK